MAKVQVGKTLFVSKQAALDRAKAIRDVYISRRCEAITEQDHIEFIFGLVSRHPEAEKKIGCGVEHFFVDYVGNYCCFWIRRIDGTTTDFSMPKCFADAEGLKRQRKTEAFRDAIDGQIEWFRDQAFGTNEKIPCAISGDLVSRNQAHVDHINFFSDLMDQFLELKGHPDVEIVAGEKGRPPKIVDLTFRREWQGFHKQHARLRVVFWRKNLTRGRDPS